MTASELESWDLNQVEPGLTESWRIKWAEMKSRSGPVICISVTLTKSQHLFVFYQQKGHGVIPESDFARKHCACMATGVKCHRSDKDTAHPPLCHLPSRSFISELEFWVVVA